MEMTSSVFTSTCLFTCTHTRYTHTRADQLRSLEAKMMHQEQVHSKCYKLSEQIITLTQGRLNSLHARVLSVTR